MTTLSVYTPSEVDVPELTDQVRSALQATLFGSRLRVTPRRIGQIAGEASAAFLAYLAAPEDGEAARLFGLRLANDGLGHTTLLALVGALQQFAWERAGTPLANTYCGLLLGGYMEGREQYLLAEQERVRNALDRARTEFGR